MLSPAHNKNALVMVAEKKEGGRHSMPMDALRSWWSDAQTNSVKRQGCDFESKLRNENIFLVSNCFLKPRLPREWNDAATDEITKRNSFSWLPSTKKT